MKIGLIGGTRGVGLQVLKQALQQQHTITVLARTPSKLDEFKTNENLIIVHGDVMNRESVDKVVKDQDVIINCLGSASLSGEETKICSNGTKILLESMKELNIKNLITVTSFGVGDSWNQTRLSVAFFLGFVIRHLIRDKNIQDKMIQESNLDWITVRPGRLTDGALTGKYRFGKGIAGGMISRADVADFILKHALNSKEHLHQSLTLAY